MKVKSRSSVAQYLADSLMISKSDKDDLIKKTAYWLYANKKNRELNYLIKDIRYFLAIKYNYQIVYIKSSRDLSKNEKDNIHNKLKAYFNTDLLEIIYKVDTNLIGGIIIESPTESLDFSVKHKLDNFVKNSESF